MWRTLTRFLLLGAVLFAADRLWWSVQPPPPVVIEAARVTALRGELARVLRRPPTREELERAIEPEVDDELLYREALARGYFEDDPVVFRRLVQNLRFAGADEEKDDVALYHEAIEMGLHETDIVVRRRLVQRMRLDLEASAAAAGPPDEAALRAHYERHADRYRSPARARIFQLYYARQHEARALEDLARLEGESAQPDAARELGDPFLLSSEQPAQTERELSDRFGGKFAEGVFAAETGSWAGPVVSAYGLHLIWIHERVAERPQTMDEVRESLGHAVMSERRREALERALAGLREGVEIEVAWPEAAG